ncbi:TIR domain protein [Rubripirellula lacrimiformis]|uniref:TIR domain protein n=1 Tax=Rubripirellula lacrimiformis TaxID=1930273 RepID=A0A517N9R1_9BACT|nr:toll/interleukin-1 receptor domain-containing protein [Rubripirellula lacrimiformis]QDT03875.1 TIR domain protein [Rubripirellula lacrimiformis]
MQFDTFISHASEDKDEVARPLAQKLQELGATVWLDEFELTLGDSLRRKIDEGLAQSRFGVVVLSPSFFAKEWPNKELDALVAREDGRGKVILPVWHKISSDDVVAYSPLLAGKLAVTTSLGIDNVASQICRVVIGHEPPTDNKCERYPQTESKPIVQSLTGRLITARSERELQKLRYEVDQQLAQSPHAPDLRMLRDDVHRALTAGPVMASPPSSIRRLTWLVRRRPALAVIAIAFAAALLAGLFYVISQW